MLDEVVEGFVESIELGPGSRRAQAIVRVLFGLLGLGLASAGAARVATVGIDGAGPHFNLAAALVFLFLGAFFLFNVTFLSQWRWPGRGFILSLVGLFLVRVLIGP